MTKKRLSFSIAMVAILGLGGCASKEITQGAGKVEIFNGPPNLEKCKFLGEIVGSQGNWFTGDLTSNKNLVIGARNELRNEAYKLGANAVYVQDMKNTNAYG